MKINKIKFGLGSPPQWPHPTLEFCQIYTIFKPGNQPTNLQDISSCQSAIKFDVNCTQDAKSAYDQVIPPDRGRSPIIFIFRWLAGRIWNKQPGGGRRYPKFGLDRTWRYTFPQIRNRFYFNGRIFKNCSILACIEH